MNKLLDLDWQTMFVPSTSLAELVLRGTLTFWFCFLFLRFLRRGTGQLGISDLLLITLIADAAQNSMAGEYKSITGGLVLVGTLVGWNYALNWLSYHIPFFDLLSQPKPVLLVSDGIIIPQNLRKELIAEDELMSLLRQNGIEDVKMVKSCQLEGSGNISVIER
jgi:uncharacterized membrane protein YcaP (DUF421 family)